MKKGYQGLISLASRAIDLAPTAKMLLSKALEQSQGWRFGSYSLHDEADLAASFLRGKQQSIVIDAGANAGLWSRDLLKQLGARADDAISAVVLVEPNKAHGPDHQLVHRLLPGKVATEWVAVGSTCSEMTLHFDTDTSALASLYARKTEHHGISLNHSQRVSVERLDGICARRGFTRVNWLKLDVEGHELEALKGAEALLSNHAIDAIQFEFGGANIDSRTFVRDFWDLLVVGCGYSLYRLLPRQRLLPLSEYSERLERFVWQNFLACAPGVAPGWPCV